MTHSDKDLMAALIDENIVLATRLYLAEKLLEQSRKTIALMERALEGRYVDLTANNNALNKERRN